MRAHNVLTAENNALYFEKYEKDVIVNEARKRCLFVGKKQESFLGVDPQFLKI